jgi:cytochrome c oxidase assembly protein subunit 15
MSDLFPQQPIWRNFFEHRLTVQFDHRTVAYLIWGLSIWHLYDLSRKHETAAFWGALMLAGAVTIQSVLGIVTLLTQAPIWFALMHQAMAVVVLTIAIIHAARLKAKQPTMQLKTAALSSSA